MFSGWKYHVVYWILRVAMAFYHPILHIKGKENVQPQGRCLICSNHTGLADPIWIILSMHTGFIPKIMAKKELMDTPLLGPLLRYVGVFGVDRQGNDVAAVKTGLRCLRDEQQLLIFPEGTRVKPGETMEPKRGAVVLANRTDSPILPVYVSIKRHPFSPITVVFGKPYKPEFSSKRASDEEMEQATRDLMDQIYEMGHGL